MIRYFDIEACKKFGFPFIWRELSHAEPAPDYSSEIKGINELEKVLTFVQSDEYYPNFPVKAAYLLCSIAGSQYFSNGNKRLSIVVLLMFLLKNDASVLDMDSSQYRSLLMEYFPIYSWEENRNIIGPHQHFLYNLSIVIGDRSRWGTDDFSILRQKVGSIFERLYQI